MQNRILALVAVALIAVVSTCSCASQAGQLDAAELAPLVRSVTTRYEAYIDAGIAPDGAPLSREEVFRRRGDIVILENALAEATGQPLEPLPSLEGDAEASEDD